jgi:hypothetical protein
MGVVGCVIVGLAGSALARAFWRLG